MMNTSLIVNTHQIYKQLSTDSQYRLLKLVRNQNYILNEQPVLTLNIQYHYMQGKKIKALY